MNTKLIKVNPAAPEKALTAEAGEILRKGGLVAIPTETVYGLAANALDPEAVGKIFDAKGRPHDNPLIVHIANYAEVLPLVQKVDPRLPALAKAFWPGPLTVIMKKSPIVPDVTSGKLDTVAIRMPSDPVAHAIIEAAGLPLAAPSANSSGKPSPTRASHVMDDMDGKIDMVVDGGSCRIGVESTVVTLAMDPPRLLRPGGVTPEELRKVLPDLVIDKAVFSQLAQDEKAQSPGMKYKHYSPKAQVTLLKGSLEGAVGYVAQKKSENSCVLCFAGESEQFNCPAIEYGTAGDGLSQASRVFDVLRQVDDEGYTEAFVRCPQATGVGLAVYNRLLRSAAFKVVEVDKKYPVIGLTGQTGAGKTTVSRYLKENGYHIIDGDILAREAVKNKEVLSALAAAFGKEVVNEDGTLNRKVTAERAFATRENTDKLNAITHPVITAMTVLEIARAESEGAKGAVVDAAALFESPIPTLCTVTAAVVAPEGVRLKRIMGRDRLTEEEALHRIRAQYGEEYYANHADILIENGPDDDYKAGADALMATIEAMM